MKRDYKFLLSLASSLALSLSALSVSRPAVSEEVQIPLPETLPVCPDKLPVLEANKDALTAATPSSSVDPSSASPSSVNPSAVAPQTVPEPGQISKPIQTSEPRQNLSASVPLTSLPEVPPITPNQTSLTQSSNPLLSIAPPVPPNSPSPDPLAGSIIPASPTLPISALPSPSEDLTPHTRYLAAPPDPLATATAEADVSVNKPSAPQATVECVPPLNSAQDEALSKSAKTGDAARAPKNSDIEKSMENAKRSLNGIHPF